MNRRRLIAVARGDEAPDLVISGAKVFSSFTREWLDETVSVAEGRIAGFGETPATGGDIERHDARGMFLVPGFIDAHVHIESSKLMVDEFARVLLKHGTTSIVCDPHEIANVLGTDGIHWLLDICEGLPLDVWVMASSCVPASSFESPRRPFTKGDLESILNRRYALGIAEMMNFPGVISGSDAEVAKLEIASATHVDGHAPGVVSHELDAYIAAGIRSDHEATTYEEALEKRRRGMWVLLREASNARNLLDLLPMVKELGTENCAFCTDDREPDFLYREGSINQMCREAVAAGLAPEDALLMATLNAARYHGLKDAGVIGPGYKADLVLLGDLESFRPEKVWKEGHLVVTGGETTGVWPGSTEQQKKLEVPLWVRRSVRNAPIEAADLRVPCASGTIRVIEIVAGQLLTNEVHAEAQITNGLAIADPSRDLAKIAVVERHHATGRIGKGFVTGFGLQHGAFASTVAHDAHNIVVVGASDEDMAAAVARLQEFGGGIVAVAGGKVLEELPLPVAGLLAELPVTEVVERLDRLHDHLQTMGVKSPSPFMTLSFLALSVIPSLKITDRGLIDVDRFAVVPLEVSR
ncbi:MAG: adenine deaminase [Actinomycetota bacterium]